MIFVDQLRDAARVADRAPNPTSIRLGQHGFWVEVRRDGKRRSRVVPFDDVELCQLNPLVAAVRELNRDAA